MRAHKAGGFTMIEMMLVILVIGVMAAFAYPSYTNFVLRGNRVDARELLQRIAAGQERFYTNRNTYTDQISGSTGLALPTISEKGYYTVTAELADGGQSYTLTATPQGRQLNDKCGNLTLSNVGAKGYTGDESNGSCW